MKKPKSSKNQYFTKEHEDAIVRYASINDLAERTKLYVDLIEPCISEMVNKIVFTYKFTSLPNISSLKEECKIWITTILDKYDPNKGSKAFSYFSIITKNWFIAKFKKYNNQNCKEIHYEDVVKELELRNITCSNQYFEVREEMEFWQHLIGEIDSWYNNFNLKENDKKVLDAIKILLNNVGEIDIFNKKAIYFFLREITGLTTKQIVNCLNRFRVRYKEFKANWDDGNV